MPATSDSAEAAGSFGPIGPIDPPEPTVSSAQAATWHTHFGMLARYHEWALARLYQHVDGLTDAEYRRDVGLFFRSVHGTLNHMLLTERDVWYPRFASGISNRVALDAEIEPDRAALRERLTAAVAAWAPLIAAWPAERFDSRLDYRNTRGVAQSLPFGLTLAHVFNHGTHHRAQLTAAITALGHDCPELDLVWMLQALWRAPA